MRNIEIKARVSNLTNLLRKVREQSPSEETVLKQHDVFFSVNKGRLKLRRIENGEAELIFYEREDTKAPSLSTYQKLSLTTQSANKLEEILAISNGIRGNVKKTRRLFMIDQTRVHIDEVDELGDFMELEVVLRDDQTLEEGKIIADKLMKQLEIHECEMMSTAYIDLLDLKNLN